jgi:RND family efflux transporter MFP subunit
MVLVGLLTGSVLAQEAPHASSSARPLEGRAPPLVGVVAATRALDLLPQVDGRVEELKVHLGERVEAGQLVAQLDTRTLALELTARQAQTQAAEAEHLRCVLLLRQARRLVEREQRISDFAAAEELEKARHAVSLAQADVALARARLDSARVEVALAKENLERARVRAPFGGVVSEEYLQAGMMAGRTTPLVRLVGDERLLRFAIPEAWVGLIRPGHEVRVRVGGMLGFRGIVERVSPELDTTSRQLKAEARMELPVDAREALPIGAVVPVEWVPPTPTGSTTPGL